MLPNNTKEKISVRGVKNAIKNVTGYSDQTICRFNAPAVTCLPTHFLLQMCLLRWNSTTSSGPPRILLPWWDTSLPASPRLRRHPPLDRRWPGGTSGRGNASGSSTTDLLRYDSTFHKVTIQEKRWVTSSDSCKSLFVIF